jgi:hypothetical protein
MAEEFGLEVEPGATDDAVREALQELYNTPPEPPMEVQRADARRAVAGGGESGSYRGHIEGRDYLRMSCIP